MLTGSFASAYYGVPRATQDVDFVIAGTPEELQRFVTLLPHDQYYEDLTPLLQSKQHPTMFNVVDLNTGWKIDLILRKERAFSKTEFERRQAATIQGIPMFIASAEDVVISKLEWAKLGRSARQIEDVAAILRVSWTEMDREYLRHWIKELELTTEWDRASHLADVHDLG